MPKKPSVLKATAAIAAPGPGDKTSVFVYRPNGITTSITLPDISIDVAANGALLIVGANGKAFMAFAPGQWLTVGAPPV
jgi:hypothetical protein